jgi:hypothetical protein
VGSRPTEVGCGSCIRWWCARTVAVKHRSGRWSTTSRNKSRFEANDGLRCCQSTPADSVACRDWRAQCR